jgi:sensor histidine kinase YesM
VREKRKKIWIDRFQTILFLRIAFYFAFYQIAVWSLVLIEQRLSVTLDGILGPRGTSYCFLLLTGIVVGVGFMFTYDAVVFTHRIVGPLYRVRQAVKAVAAGEEQEPMTLRKGDYLQELKDDFNEMLEALEGRGAGVLKKPATAQDRAKAVSV